MKFYVWAILDHPRLALLLLAVLVAGLGLFAKNFELDASADSLLLENDPHLQYYRAVRDTYGSDDFLVITYAPRQDRELFSSDALNDLKRLRDELKNVPRVASVTSILDVPLIASPRVTLAELAEHVRTLEDPSVDPLLAKNELRHSPLYSNLILSKDGRTTALLAVLERDQVYLELLSRRERLRDKQRLEGFSEITARELEAVEDEFHRYSSVARERQSDMIAEVRTILAKHEKRAKIHLGGVPMIVSDMVDFIRHDLMVFGVGVLVFLVGMLSLIFRQPRFVILPMLCCLASALSMFGLLGLFGWRVTVVSSNFISLVLIITLSLAVHLIVRYNEIIAENPDADQYTLVREMVASKALPSLYTVLTTVVAFVSLIVSDIRPVIDFGWMMALGIGVAFLLTMVLLPAGLVMLKPQRFIPKVDLTGRITSCLAYLNETYGRKILLLSMAIAVFGLAGIGRLTVENRFIDNFKESTEIYQGMELIDRQLGGTTPLEIIIDPPAGAELDGERLNGDDPFEDDPFAAEAGITATSYWFNAYQLENIEKIQQVLDEHPATGKVLSLATTGQLLKQLNEDRALDDLSLAVIYKKLPSEIKKSLIDPYLSKDGQQLRFAIRVVESNPKLHRQKLLQTLEQNLVNQVGLNPEQVHLNGMFVLYNNLLQSLYRSQILTLGAVFAAIMVMFLVLFRSWQLALLAIIPNILAAGSVLGLMGWLGLPLDIMTITIAAITIGIAVDDTIHYVHRFKDEVAVDGNHLEAVRRCHHSVGKAMYYTSITVILGFSILALSNFIPTIYFGLFTGLAMAIAMLGNLTLLALLLIKFKPEGNVCNFPKE
ncbi:MAG: transporter [Desulfuromonas sp.]|nr:MAG: transporter [Desulfuromonas sp.]